MKLSEAIERVRIEKPHSFSDDHCTMFINDVEMQIQDYLGYSTDEFIKYNWETDGNKELMAPAPYDRLYISWLKAKIDYANEEYESYANNQEQFNADLADYKAWAMRESEVESVSLRFRNWW